MPSIHPLPLSIFAKSKYSPQDLSIAGNIVTHNPTSLRFFTRTVTGRDIPQMRGEAAGLRAMALTAPDLVPKIIGFEVDESKREAGMVTQYFDFGGGGGSSSGETQRDLARKIAKMHTEPKNNGGGSSRGLHDDEEGNTIDADDRDYKWTGKYGFGVPTHCGVTEQDNTWEESWEVFYRDRRLGDLVRRIGDKQISEEWERMKSRAIPLLLANITPAPTPVILHGDLWSGNKGFDRTTSSPVIFDPACYYGHNEADLGIMHMFGGFTEDFFDEYHKIHPRSSPYYPQRQKLYELYHHLNHTLMFGGSYKSGALGIMRSLNRWAQEVE